MPLTEQVFVIFVVSKELGLQLILGQCNLLPALMGKLMQIVPGIFFPFSFHVILILLQLVVKRITLDLLTHLIIPASAIRVTAS